MVLSIEPLLGGGGSGRRALSPPPPPPNENPAALVPLGRGHLFLRRGDPQTAGGMWRFCSLSPFGGSPSIREASEGKGPQRRPKGGWAGGWRGLPKRLVAVTVGYKCR